MWRANLMFAVIALAATVQAGTPVAPERPTCPRSPDDARDTCVRAQLATQLADEAAVVERSLQMVLDKLAGGTAVRERRLAAAYRVLRAGTSVRDDDPIATARRRAAARYLIERDLDERHLLADEAAQLRAAAAKLGAEARRVPDVALPAPLERPARGTIVRHFGTLVHDRSKATLARRGIDLDVDARAPAIAPADGIVRYAGPIRGLDSGIILDHGGYYTVIAKLGELAVPVGAPVVRGDRVGRAARHRVYLEVRVKLGAGGRPIDPEPLFPERAPKKR